MPKHPGIEPLLKIVYPIYEYILKPSYDLAVAFAERHCETSTR